MSSQTYRWNVAEHAAGYDAAAEVLHPHYLEIHEFITNNLRRPTDAEFLAIDLGGGSGRLAERILERYPRSSVMVIDQSQAFLDLAAARLARFGQRADFHVSRLQEDWTKPLPAPPMAIVSTSAIHHLLSDEKRGLYQQAFSVLETGGMLLNGDEIRDENDAAYLAALTRWSDHMLALVDQGQIVATMRPLLENWRERNVNQFAKPRESGDDCHETLSAQLGYLRDCGFREVDAPWRKQMWAVMQGIK